MSATLYPFYQDELFFIRKLAQEFSRQGAINIFIRPQAGYVVTALGEAPASTVMQFAHTVTRIKPRQ